MANETTTDAEVYPVWGLYGYCGECPNEDHDISDELPEILSFKTEAEARAALDFFREVAGDWVGDSPWQLQIIGPGQRPMTFALSDLADYFPENDAETTTEDPTDD